MIITSFSASKQLHGVTGFFVAKGRFNLKPTLSSCQALEGDAQTSGNTAPSTCTITCAQCGAAPNCCPMGWTQGLQPLPAVE